MGARSSLELGAKMENEFVTWENDISAWTGRSTTGRLRADGSVPGLLLCEPCLSGR